MIVFNNSFLSVTVNGVSGARSILSSAFASSSSGSRDNNTRPTEVQKAGSR